MKSGGKMMGKMMAKATACASLAMFGAPIVMTLTACSSANQEERRWTEDVSLEDGTIVQIERHVIFDETNALGGGAANAVERKATLQFIGDLAALPPWDYPRRALVLYRKKDIGTWIIVATSSSCEDWRADGAPYPPYWEYELLDGVWRKVPLRQESVGRSPNLFYRYHAREFGPHVSEQTKQQLQSDRRIADKYRSILEKPQDFHCM
jgi:hypothetical protein